MLNRLITSILLALVLAAKPCWGDKLPPSNSCTANASPGRIVFSWISVASAESYAISRDGVFLGTAPPSFPTVWVDYPPPGTHRYCVVAQAAGYEPSDPCCANAPSAYAPGTPSCSASNNLVGKVLVQWGDVDGETGYVVTRDGTVVYQAGANQTSFLDQEVPGYATYCVRAFNPMGSSASCCVVGTTAEANGGRSRLSWGTCDPQISNRNFQGPGSYELILSVTGVAVASYWHDTEIYIRPAVPDAWRFDDAGCATSDNLFILGSLKSCPPLLGGHPLSIHSYHLSSAGDGTAVLRMAASYETFVPDPTKRYLLWRISFNHQYSVAGADSDPETCDGAGQYLEFSSLTTLGVPDAAYPAVVPLDPQDMQVRWNGDAPVRSLPTTWGRVKSLYH